MLNFVKNLINEVNKDIKKAEDTKKQKKASFEKEFNRWGKLKTESPKFLR
ncbi:MAG: hypothetical protein GXX10_11300 [Clostridiaceae bacterium]|nr:hypothetical protein [Clostridiaceae bacterium]